MSNVGSLPDTDGQNCSHPIYRERLRDDYRDALRYGGHAPHVLERAFELHLNLRDRGAMLAG
jgi:succinyl-CoA:acetate CoA-transferase